MDILTNMVFNIGRINEKKQVKFFSPYFYTVIRLINLPLPYELYNYEKIILRFSKKRINRKKYRF